MIKFQTIFASSLLSAALTIGAPVYAKAEQPVGTVHIDETQFGFILGGSTGGGTLRFRGRTYAFKIGGLSFGANIGVSKIAASGEIYRLKTIKDFPGTYAKAAANMTFGVGAGGLQLENEHGVRMTLRGTTKGLQLDAGGGGVKITMK
ncbi:MAG: DUF1134 domain-containing protein [Sandarakinorhabdus sp.]|nr:DUF1134 domain-containing protein [Sandarakinorhabdus sp.]